MKSTTGFREPKVVPFEQSACADCIHWQDSDCYEPMRDVVGKWVVPADRCSGQVTDIEYRNLFGQAPPTTLEDHRAPMRSPPMPLTDEQRTGLRRLAEAATAGPWAALYSWNGGKPTWRVSVPELVTIAHDLAEQNATFIATADPATVTELLDALAEAERERDRWKGAADLLSMDATVNNWTCPYPKCLDFAQDGTEQVEGICRHGEVCDYTAHAAAWAYHQASGCRAKVPGSEVDTPKGVATDAKDHA